MSIVRVETRWAVYLDANGIADYRIRSMRRQQAYRVLRAHGIDLRLTYSFDARGKVRAAGVINQAQRIIDENFVASERSTVRFCSRFDRIP